MKAATGELNLTLITVIAIGLLLAAFTAFFPNFFSGITDGFQVGEDEGTGYLEDYEFTDYIETELF